jgi:hypothetical protein
MDLAASAGALLSRLRRWTAASWAVPADAAGPGAGSRADVVAVVVQQLADLAADAERRPRLVVPRPDGVSPADQLAVMIDDVLRTDDPAAASAAATHLAALRAALAV